MVHGASDMGPSPLWEPRDPPPKTLSVLYIEEGRPLAKCERAPESFKGGDSLKCLPWCPGAPLTVIIYIGIIYNAQHWENSDHLTAVQQSYPTPNEVEKV